MTSPGAANLNNLAAGIAQTAFAVASTAHVDVRGIEAAGHAHVQNCLYCRDAPQVDADLCKCIDRCNHAQCLKPLRRPDPVAYSEGFTPPPVPIFRKEADAA